MAACRFRGAATDTVALQKHVDTLGAKLDIYEQILSKQEYLAGNEVTLADLFHLPYGAKLYVAGHGDVIESRPHVKRYAP